jgi:hypothetical protein
MRSAVAIFFAILWIIVLINLLTNYRGAVALVGGGTNALNSFFATATGNRAVFT